MGQHRQLPERLRQVHPQFRTPVHRDHRLLGRRVDRAAPGQDRLPGDDVLVRRDALVHDRPRLGDPAAAAATPDAERPWKPPGERPHRRGRGAADRRLRRPRHLRRLDRRDGPEPGRRWRSGSAGWSFGIARLRRLPAAPGPAADEDGQGRPAGAARGRGGRVRACWSPSRTTRSRRRRSATAARLAARKRRGIHVLSLLNVPAHLPLDAPLPRSRRRRQTKIEQAKLIGGQRVTGHVAAGPARPGAEGDRRGGGRDQGGGDRHAAHATANGAPLYGKTLQSVLGKRPCRVIVAADPTGERPTGRSPLRSEPSAIGGAGDVRGRERQLQSPPMASRERIGSSGTRVLSSLILVLGIVIVVRTPVAGGGLPRSASCSGWSSWRSARRASTSPLRTAR